MADLRDFDIFLITFDEPDVEQKLERMRARVPRLKHIHGVVGEMNAWREAARQSRTTHFVKIDADLEIRDEFSFQMKKIDPADRRVHVWRSLNPVNGLVYGHGSMQLFSREHVLSLPDNDYLDPTMSAATAGFCIQEECATHNRFDVSPFMTWRAAFRECVRLASENCVFPGSQIDLKKTRSRLQVWSTLGRDTPFGEYCILGARMGTIVGLQQKSNWQELRRQISLTNLQCIWNTLNVKEHLPRLLSDYGTRLQLFVDWPVCEFTAEQSRFCKQALLNELKDLRPERSS